MKIGVETVRLPLWGEDRYRMIRAAGFDCVDYDMSHTDAEPYTLDAGGFEKYLLREKALADDAGVEIFQMHGPWRWPPQDFTPEQRAERMEKMKRSVEGAAIIGCKNWVIHPIMPFDWQDIGKGHDQDTWDLNMEFMSELLRHAKEFDVTICFENMPMVNFSMGAPGRILKFVKEMNDDHFKICLDTGHAAVFPGQAPGNAVREMGDEIRVLHVHDNDGTYDRHYLPYFGVIDWPDFVQSLKEINFNGVISLETSPPQNMPLEAAEAVYAAMARIAKTLTF